MEDPPDTLTLNVHNSFLHVKDARVAAQPVRRSQSDSSLGAKSKTSDPSEYPMVQIVPGHWASGGQWQGTDSSATNSGEDGGRPPSCCAPDDGPIAQADSFQASQHVVLQSSSGSDQHNNTTTEGASTPDSQPKSEGDLAAPTNVEHVVLQSSSGSDQHNNTTTEDASTPDSQPKFEGDLAAPTNVVSEPITTLMISGFPYCLHPQEVVDVIDQQGFSDAYDLFFMPRRTKTTRASQYNLGYAFVNFKTPEYAIAFARAFNNAAFPNSTKLCSIRPAHKQGFEANGKDSGDLCSSGHFRILRASV